MLSATVRSGISDSSWKMQTMPARLAAAGSAKVDGAAVEAPCVPSSGWTTPAMILISVDLPAPFSPRTAWIGAAPAGEVDVAPARARRHSAWRRRCSDRKGAAASDRSVTATSMRLLRFDKRRAGPALRPAASGSRGLLRVLGVLRHDLRRGDVHAAGRELVGREEVVGEVRPVVRRRP